MKSKKVVIFGGTGFLGLSLANHLEGLGYQVVLVARNTVDTYHHLELWDGASVGEWAAQLEGARAIINLAGRSVDCIKTPDNCDLILRSRVNSVRAIGKALKTVEQLPEVWIQMSTAHIYGDPPQYVCTEHSATGYGLAPEVGRAWEQALQENLPVDMRHVLLRTGFVMGPGGGALTSLGRLVKLGAGGTVGKGEQGMSWIHQSDFNRIVSEVLEQENRQGIYNVSAPKPVANKVFMRGLRKAMRMPIGLPSPEWMVRIGARFIFKTDPELALYGRYVMPQRLLDEGFTFKYPALDEALKQLL